MCIYLYINKKMIYIYIISCTFRGVRVSQCTSGLHLSTTDSLWWNSTPGEPDTRRPSWSLSLPPFSFSRHCSSANLNICTFVSPSSVPASPFSEVYPPSSQSFASTHNEHRSQKRLDGGEKFSTAPVVL